MKQFPLLLLLALAFALLSIAAFYTGCLRFNYPARSEFPVQGIDVSHHQGTIAWEQITPRKVGFVFIKATEGADFKDQRFRYNWQQATKHNIPAGAYHFFTFCKTGREQARNFIATVPNTPQQLPPVIDLEFGGNCNSPKATPAVISQIDTLQALLFAHYHKRPIFYVTQEFYERYLLHQLPANPLWFRDIYNRPAIADQRGWLFWQYGNRGHVAGINSYVDLNVFRGSQAAFDQLLQ